MTPRSQNAFCLKPYDDGQWHHHIRRLCKNFGIGLRDIRFSPLSFFQRGKCISFFWFGHLFLPPSLPPSGHLVRQHVNSLGKADGRRIEAASQLNDAPLTNLFPAMTASREAAVSDKHVE